MITEYSPLFVIFMALSFLIISIIFDIQKNKKSSSLVALLMVITYSVIFGLRDYSIGSDTKSYIDNFLNINWDFELVFTILTDSIRYFTTNARIYLISITVIYGICIFIAYYTFGRKINKHIIIFIWCLLFSQSSIIGTINYFRQILGFSVFLIGFSLYITKSKFNIAAFIIMMMSIFIHSSNAILLFSVIVIRYINIKIILAVLILSLLSFVFDVGGYISRNFNDYYIVSRTISRHIYFNDRRSIVTIYLNIIMYSTHLLFFLYFVNCIKYDKSQLPLYELIKFYMFVFSIAIFMSFNREMAIRYYLLLPFLIPIIYMFSTGIDKTKRLIKPFLISYTLLHLCYLLSRPWFIDQLSGNITL